VVLSNYSGHNGIQNERVQRGGNKKKKKIGGSPRRVKKKRKAIIMIFRKEKKAYGGESQKKGLKQTRTETIQVISFYTNGE